MTLRDVTRYPSVRGDRELVRKTLLEAIDRVAVATRSNADLVVLRVGVIAELPLIDDATKRMAGRRAGPATRYASIRDHAWQTLSSGRPHLPDEARRAGVPGLSACAVASASACLEGDAAAEQGQYESNTNRARVNHGPPRSNAQGAMGLALHRVRQCGRAHSSVSGCLRRSPPLHANRRRIRRLLSRTRRR